MCSKWIKTRHWCRKWIYGVPIKAKEFNNYLELLEEQPLVVS